MPNKIFYERKDAGWVQYPGDYNFDLDGVRDGIVNGMKSIYGSGQGIAEASSGETFRFSDSGGLLVIGSGMAVYGGEVISRSAGNATDHTGATIDYATNSGKYVFLQIYTELVPFPDGRPASVGNRTTLKHAFRVAIDKVALADGASLGTGKTLIGEICAGQIGATYPYIERTTAKLMVPSGAGVLASQVTGVLTPDNIPVINEDKIQKKIFDFDSGSDVGKVFMVGANNNSKCEKISAENVTQSFLDSVVAAAIAQVTISDTVADAIALKTLQKQFRVGAWYMSDDPTSPATALGFGTWVRVKGKMIVGVDEDDDDFDAAGNTGGAKTVSLTSAQNGPHTHEIRVSGSDNFAGGQMVAGRTNDAQSNPQTVSSGNGAPHENLPPYYATFIWRRTA